MTQSLKDWDESKDAQILGRFKSQGCHFHRPNDLFWMQRRILARGWSRYLVTIALTMYGSWWHEKNKPISNSDAARLYGIGREKAADIYKMFCEEFDLELEPIKTANGRDAGFIMRRVSSTRHIGDSSVFQETGSVVQEAQVCNAQSTPVSPTGHLLETIQEPKQDSFPRELDELPKSLIPLLNVFTETKSDASRGQIEYQLRLINKKYGEQVVEDQLRQAIASEWKTISISQYEKHNPEALSAESNAAQDSERRRLSMIQHIMLNGLKSTVWNSHREEYESLYYQLVKEGKIDEEGLEAS